ncbi:MAG: TonB-dependent receptor, partial [Planctomycetota bacterium]
IAIARDQNGDLIYNYLAIKPRDVSYELHQNESNRHGGNLGLQWAPTDVTEIMFNVNYSEQTQKRSFDGVKTRAPNANENAIEGQLFSSAFNQGGIRAQPMTSTDPQEEWVTIDTRTRTMTRELSRGGLGDLVRSTGGDLVENLSTTLELNQDLTDRFRVSGQIGYSSSESKSLPSRYTNMQNFTQVNQLLLGEGGPDIQPTGYELNGNDFTIIAGTALINYGTNNSGQYTDANGNVRQDWWDNTNVITGFNPADSASFHLSNIQEADRDIKDTQSSGQIDFDFDLDVLGFTTLEFGARVTSREKTVDDQRFTFASSSAADPILDAQGNTIGLPGGPLQNIRGDLIASDGLDYDNFMSSLGYSRSNVTSGWTPIDVEAAFDLVVGTPDLFRSPNNLNSRSSELDTSALYLKQSFSFFDDRLTGDVGVRYVETDVETRGFSGATFHDFSGNANESEFDIVYMRSLLDSSLPSCPAIIRGSSYANQPIQNFEQKFQRVDGLGWDTSVGTSFDAATGTWTIDPSQWTRLPDAGPCSDPGYIAMVAAFTDNDPNNNVDNINWQTMWRYADVDFSRNNGWDYTDAQNPTNITWDSDSNSTQLSAFTIDNQLDL